MISCITSVMNREENLAKMLPTWTKVDKIKDFVIVDWNSRNPIINNPIIQEQMAKYKNIKIIRVEGQTYYHRCQAFNLANLYTDQNNKILLMYWPEINNDDELEELKKRNFFNLENEYSILKWSTKYKFLNKKSSHLNIDGHAKVAEELNKFLLKQENNHKINLI